jgi:hypothetical protein
MCDREWGTHIIFIGQSKMEVRSNVSNLDVGSHRVDPVKTIIAGFQIAKKHSWQFGV